MAAHFSASFTMFVFLKGHHVLESYFTVSDCRVSANDADLSVCSSRLQCRVPESVDHRGWD